MTVPSTAPRREERPLPRVCIVSHQALGAIRGGRDGHAGGVERQTTLLARWLATRGFAVSLIVWNEGQGAITRIDGVDVIACCRRDAGLPGLRFVHPRWTSLARALRRADAAVYYHNCAEYVTGQVALWCRLHGRKFVYSVASDPECDPRLPALRHRRERLLFRYGLRHADAVITQTQRQADALRDGWGLPSRVLPMPCAVPAAGLTGQDSARHQTPRVVWVGRLSAEKRLDRLIAIATELPDVRFDVAGAPSGSDAAVDALVAAAAALPNVRLLGQVARDAMSAVYAGATCLLCTSDYEGFPNTFLEAWSHGVPVVSTVDPDGVIAARNLGRTAHGPDTLAAAIRELTTSLPRWRDASRSAHRYYAEQHAPEPALRRFEQVFREVLGRS